MAHPFNDTMHLSIDHLAEADVELLARRHGETSMIGEAVDGEVHLMVDFYGDEHDPLGVAGGRLRDEGYSDEFVALLRWAAAKGARAVALDADGAVVDELPVLANGSGSGRAPGR